MMDPGRIRIRTRPGSKHAVGSGTTLLPPTACFKTIKHAWEGQPSSPSSTCWRPSLHLAITTLSPDCLLSSPHSHPRPQSPATEAAGHHLLPSLCSEGVGDPPPPPSSMAPSVLVLHPATYRWQPRCLPLLLPLFLFFSPPFSFILLAGSRSLCRLAFPAEGFAPCLLWIFSARAEPLPLSCFPDRGQSPCLLLFFRQGFLPLCLQWFSGRGLCPPAPTLPCVFW